MFGRSLQIILVLFLLPQFFFAEEIIEGKISRNVDGDTVWVKLPDRDVTLKIRMLEIDAPEWHVVTPNGTFGQGVFGEKAGHALAEIVPVGTQVQVKDYGKDTYGRTLGVVLSEGQDVNLQMIEVGWAIPYIYCTEKECAPGYFEEHAVQRYIDACEKARKEGLGVFDPQDPLLEMPFEFRLRVQEREPDKFVGDYETKKFVSPTEYKKVDVCKRVFFSSEKLAKKLGFSKK